MKVIVITGTHNNVIGVVQAEKYTEAVATMAKGGLKKGDYIGITYNLNEVKAPQKVHIITRAEKLEEAVILPMLKAKGDKKDANRNK